MDVLAKKSVSRESSNTNEADYIGTDVMILKIFYLKILAKKLAFFAQTAATFCKKNHNIVFFLEKRHFFRRKL
jgi:hypothetical protein